MDKPTSNKILHAFNYDSFSALALYAESEMAKIQRALEVSSDFIEIRYLQGRLLELRKLTRLREILKEIPDG